MATSSLSSYRKFTLVLEMNEAEAAELKLLVKNPPAHLTKPEYEAPCSKSMREAIWAALEDAV